MLIFSPNNLALRFHIFAPACIRPLSLAGSGEKGGPGEKKGTGEKKWWDEKRSRVKKDGQWKPSRKIKHLPCISRLVIPAHGDNLRIPWLLQEFCETRGGWGKNPSGFQCKPRQAPRLRWSVDRCRLVKMAAIVCKTCLNVCMQDFFNFRQWGRIIIHKKVKLLLVDNSHIQLDRTLSITQPFFWLGLLRRIFPSRYPIEYFGPRGQERYIASVSPFVRLCGTV